MPVQEEVRPCVGKRILWLDDEFQAFPGVRYEMEATGATVDTAISLAEAERMLTNIRYDLLVLDALVLRGGAALGTRRYEGLRLLNDDSGGPDRIVVLSVLSEKALDLKSHHRVRGYYHKVQLGPRLEQFHKQIESLLLETTHG